MRQERRGPSPLTRVNGCTFGETAGAALAAHPRPQPMTTRPSEHARFKPVSAGSIRGAASPNPPDARSPYRCRPTLRPMRSNEPIGCPHPRAISRCTCAPIGQSRRSPTVHGLRRRCSGSISLIDDRRPATGGAGTDQRKELGRGGRCSNHGGASTAPRTSEGRQRIAEAQRRRWAARL